MERKIVLIRHAKSSWAEIGQSDFDRPLNERGERDAPEMGKRLKHLNVLPDLVIASTAKRAKQTAKKIAEAIGYDKDEIQWNEQLYHCEPGMFEEVIKTIPEHINTAFIVAHNPGITQFSNRQSHQFHIDNMPTCAAIGAVADCGNWANFADAEKKIFLFEYPKKESWL